MAEVFSSRTDRSREAADALAYLLTSNNDLCLTQARHPKIQFHPLREYAGLKLEKAA